MSTRPNQRLPLTSFGIIQPSQEMTDSLEISRCRSPMGQSPVQIQLVPHSDSLAQSPMGQVVERKLQDGRILKIGRLVIKDGEPVMRGNKVLLDDDIWFASKVVSRIHAELWTRDGVVYIKDIGSSSGTFLNKMRLSPSGKESRPYPLKHGDVIQFGIDYKGKPEDIYKSVLVKVMFHDQEWIKASRNAANHVNFRSALKSLLIAANPYGSGTDKGTSESDSNTTDCCICIGTIAPYQALFIAPCSHCFHFKCVSPIVSQSAMFQCPLCRQVANLTASVSVESLEGVLDSETDNSGPDCRQEQSSSISIALDASHQAPSASDQLLESPTAIETLSSSMNQSQNATKGIPISGKITSFTSRLQSLLIRGGVSSGSNANDSPAYPSRAEPSTPSQAALRSPVQRLVPRSESPHWIGGDFGSRAKTVELREEEEEEEEEDDLNKSLNIDQFRESLDPRQPDPLSGQGPSSSRTA